MTSMQIVLLLLGAGTLISVVYLIAAVAKKSKEMVLSGFIMLFSQPAGILYYLGQLIARKLLPDPQDINLDHISFSKDRHERMRLPDVEQETQSLPLEEVFLISTNAERRKRLLAELKKEQILSLATIAKAFDNDDPETSHYAAAAITNIKADYENELRRFDNKHRRGDRSKELVRRYSDHVLKYLRSGILDQIEMKKYSFLYINLMTAEDNAKDLLGEEDYANIVSEAIFVGSYPIAEQWALTAYALGESERNYLNLLKVYYYTAQTELFLSTLDKLKKSDIPLSPDGISLVRFFIAAHRRNSYTPPPDEVTGPPAFEEAAVTVMLPVSEAQTDISPESESESESAGIPPVRRRHATRKRSDTRLAGGSSSKKHR